MPITSSGLATSFITFSRPGASGGGATVTDRDGKIKWAGHNLLLASEQFNAAQWTTFASTVTSNSATAPNGTTTADTFAADGTNNWHYLVGSASAGYPRTASFFVKKNTHDFVQILFSGDANPWANFDVATGVVGSSGTDQTASITSIGNGWYLCSVTTSSATAANVYISLVASASAARASGGTFSTSVFLWGAHLYRSDLGGMQLNPAMPAGMQSYYPTTPRNLLGYTEDFNSWSKTLTTVTSNAIVAPNGLQTADKLIAANSAGVEGYISLSPNLTNSKETLSCYMKAGEWGYGAFHVRDATNGFTTVYFNLLTGVVASAGAGWTNTGMQSVGNGWYRCYGTKERALSQAVVIAPSINGTNFTTAGDGTSGIYLWGAQLSDSASLDTYVPVYGAAVTSAAYYAPRLDFDGATLAAKGLLVEEARTNLLLYSNDMTFSPNWTAYSTSLVTTSNSATGPDGLTSANTITLSANGRVQILTLTSGTTYTISVWLRTDTGTKSIQIGDINQTGGLTTVTVTTTWQRFSFTFTKTNTAGYLGIYQVGAGLSTSGTLYAYGWQFEAGSFATSYIPNGSAVAGATRAADVASVSTQAFPYSGTEGTIVVAANAIAPSSIANDVPLSLDQSVSADTRVSFYRLTSTNVSGVYIPIAGTPQANMTGGAIVANTNFKLGAAMKENDFAFTKDGASVATDPSGSVPSVTQMTLGRTIYTASQFTGWIRQVTYLPRRISNAELQSRTA